jgi:hypothetical protein
MKQKIEQLKKLYITRDIHAINDMYQVIFKDNTKPILIGTSNAEFYFNKEDIIKLFKSDLDSWGDVYIDTDSLTSHHIGPFEVVHVPSTIRQTFDVTEDTYKSFSQYIDEIKEMNHASNYQKLLLVQQLLSHLLSDRPHGKRCYDWDLDINFIMKKDQAFLMMFSMPINELTPDVRLDDFDDYNQKIYQKELSMIAPHTQDEVDKNLLSGIADHIIYLKNASSISLNEKQFIFDIKDNYVSFMGIGYYTKQVTLDERLQNIMANVYDDEDPKRKLFNLRRDIANHFYHDAIGNDMKVQFRVIGIARKIDTTYIIEYIKISLPFNLILEEKTNNKLAKNIHG